MIDYDKLKVAHELASKIKTHYLVHIVGGKHPAEGSEFTLVDWIPDMQDYVTNDMDALIDRLQELTQDIKPKYKVGDEVWHLLHDEVVKSTIIEDDITSSELLYRLESGWWEEIQIHTSRASLIESQLEYWNKLRYPTIAECQHDHGYKGSIIICEGDIGSPFKCIKCGEYYKDECRYEDSGMMDAIDYRLKCKKCGRFHE
jgi:hypothetical protein